MSCIFCPTSDREMSFLPGSPYKKMFSEALEKCIRQESLWAFGPLGFFSLSLSCFVLFYLGFWGVMTNEALGFLEPFIFLGSLVSLDLLFRFVVLSCLYSSCLSVDFCTFVYGRRSSYRTTLNLFCCFVYYLLFGHQRILVISWESLKS